MDHTILMITLSILLLPLSLLSLLLAASFFASKKKVNPRLPPGPTNLPIVGSLHRLGGLPHRSLLDLSRRHGPLMFLRLGRVPTVVASSAATAEELMRARDLDCCSRPVLTSTERLSYGCSDIAFSPYGAKWRELRKVCIVEFFSSKRVLMFRSIREEEVRRMIDTIASSKSAVNLSATMVSLSNDITCRAALGKKYYGGANGEASVLHDILTETQAMLGGFFFADYVPALGWLDVLTGMMRRLEKNFADLDSFYEKVIDEHTDSKKGTVSDGAGEDTMDALLRIQRDGGNLTKDDIKGVLMNIFVGGSDTTSSAVEWAMSELIRNPHSMKKAQHEVRNLVGNKGKVEEDDLPQLQYLKCVVKETMRLHPPVPLLVHRETMNPFTIGGFDVPARTRVTVNAFAIGRDGSSWERPDEFDPERFVGSRVELKGHDFELVPFGAGRRICPGMHVGLLVVELALANLLYAFDWGLPEGMPVEELDMEEAVGVTVHRKSDLRLVATKWNFV